MGQLSSTHERRNAQERIAKLVERAQAGCLVSQMDVLALTRPLKDAAVARIAKQYRFSPQDVEDAQQEATLWVREAIRCYEPESAQSANCAFTTFLFRVIDYRMKNHVRRLCLQRRRVASVSVTDAVSANAFRKAASVRCDIFPPSDPGQYLIWCETQQRMTEAIACLSEDHQGLWTLLCGGTSLTSCAEQLGISYDQAKRARRQVVSRLRELLHDSASGDD